MPSRPLVLIALALVASVAPAAATATTATTAGEPITASVPHATMTYYSIAGRTAGQLRAQLNVRGPTDGSGAHFDAVTRWRYSWSWPGYGTAACRLGKADVTVRVQVVFPRWTPPTGADAGLVASWRRYVRALARHELGHADFARGHRAAVLHAIRGATCASAVAAAQRQLDRIRRHDLSYDASTRHGATQGATFP